MKKTASIILGLALLVTACSAPKKGSHDSDYLFKVGDKEVTNEEFIYVFNKNNFNNDSVITRQEIDEYLELFVNFKLKVKEAESLGLQNEEAFIQELETYRKQLAKPYLTETTITNALIEEAYERSKQEVNASHILITVDPGASPQDTLAAYQKITALRDRAINGEDFNALARSNSQDPSAVQNGGNLGYFTSMQMVYPFEEAAYATAEGEVSEPFRTRYGYHIVKVHDKRESRGKIKVAHIMIRAAQGMSVEDSVAARKKAEEIYRMLDQGADWFETASEYSEDLNTKDRGGELPWFGTGNMVPSFENAAFALENPKDISEPVKTPYGWHIIRLLERQSVPALEDVRENIARQINRDSRAEVNKKALIKRLKEENSFQENTEVLEQMVALVSTAAVSGNWEKAQSDSLGSKAVFTINLKPYYVSDFISLAERSAEGLNRGGTAEPSVRNLYDRWTEMKLVEYEEEHLADKYDDYRLLYQEYREGILLFELMDRKVWSKATRDTSGLRNYYQENIEKYQWGKRFNAAIIKLSDASLADEVKPLLKADLYPVSGSTTVLEPGDGDMLFNNLHRFKLDSLARRVNAKSSLILTASLPEEDEAFADSVRQTLSRFGINGEKLRTQGTESSTAALAIMSTSPKDMEAFLNEGRPLSFRVDYGRFEVSGNEMLQDLPAEKGVYEVTDDENALIRIYEVLEPQAKQLSEIRGQVISDYQEHLEKEWVAELREKYPVEINRRALNEIYRKFENE
ncbi:peptidylprolyl isomerase [Roseivirga sp. BDSF3-8]|uniref:peptidylprolyl isomerase n=1 Tax=Roseivirga sp. BDSF3-8 TaxID=3241598 RepID=UPI0035325163